MNVLRLTYLASLRPYRESYLKHTIQTSKNALDFDFGRDIEPAFLTVLAMPHTRAFVISDFFLYFFYFTEHEVVSCVWVRGVGVGVAAAGDVTCGRADKRVS